MLYEAALCLHAYCMCLCKYVFVCRCIEQNLLVAAASSRHVSINTSSSSSTSTGQYCPPSSLVSTAAAAAVLFVVFTYMNDTIWYDTKEEFNVDSVTAEWWELNLARKKYEDEETKTNKRQCPLSSVQVKIDEGSPEGIGMTMEERI